MATGTRVLLFAIIGLWIVGTPVRGLFPGASPEDGDYRHLYPTVCLSLRVFETEHSFSYLLGWLEDLRYPKDRIHFQFLAEENYLLSESIRRWSNSMGRFYLSVRTMETTGDEWYEQGLVFGRKKSCAFALLTTSDHFLSSDSLLNLIAAEKTVVSPLILEPFGLHSNGFNLVELEHLDGRRVESRQVYFVRAPMLINLKQMDSSYLSFEPNNVRAYNREGHPLDVFGFSAYDMGVPLFIDNHHFYGHFLDSRSKTTSEHKALLSSLLNQLQDGGPGVALHSAALPPWTPQPTTFGFDRVLVVNLERRPERMQRMERVMRTLGIEFTRFDATDGRLLTERELAPIHELPGYLDPFHKRPLKRGEIGCFLSHYRIWTEIVDEELDRALVFEDDIRFTENATRILRGLIEDLTKERTDWDLIYLGRKKNDPQAKEFFVPGHRYLSTVTYSYWTLGYAISRQGAQKLLDARPLDRLVALDEFLPIMYDQHPNREWKAHFGRRDLRAFAAYPVIVTPMKYTHEPGYVSDTESSDLLGNSTRSATQPTAHFDSAVNVGLTNSSKTEL